MFSNLTAFVQEAELLKTIGNSTRLAILFSLCQREQTVNTIVGNFQLDQSLVSHHLIKLKDRGVLTTRREGKHIFYSVKNPQGMIEIMQAVQNMVEGKIIPQNEPYKPMVNPLDLRPTCALEPVVEQRNAVAPSGPVA